MEHEKDLIKKIVDGDASLFEQIVLEYQNLVFTVCLNVLKDVHDAENIAQESFISGYCSLSAFRGEDLKPWLCKIALNKAIDFKRKRVRVLSHEVPSECIPESASENHSLDSLLEKKEVSEKLNGILSAMPKKYAAVINDHYYKQLSVKEIAVQRKLPEKTVETQLYRAKKKIRERWGDFER